MMKTVKTKRMPTAEEIQEAIASSTPLQRKLAEIMEKAVADTFSKPTMTQSQAYSMFGRANVERWCKRGLLEARRAESGRVAYYTADLLNAQNKSFYV